MSGSFWLALLFALLGAGSWLAEYRAQRGAGPGFLAVRPPRWVAWLCGNPRGNGTLELERAVRQLTSLVFLLGAPLSLLAGLALHLQAALLFLAYALVALPAFALVEWARRRAEKEQEAVRELREPGYQG